MSTIYKLTENGYTRNNTEWKVGITHSVDPCDNPCLCTSQVIHGYENLNLGLLLNPAQAQFKNIRVFVGEGKIVVKDWNKCGVFSLNITQEVDLPDWYINEKTQSKTQLMFAILCAESVLPLYETRFPNNAQPREAINAAKDIFVRADNDTNAAWVAADASADAADAAADAAWAAASDAAWAAAYAAWTAADAAWAAWAAYAAWAAAKLPNLFKLADLAVEKVMCDYV